MDFNKKIFLVLFVLLAIVYSVALLFTRRRKDIDVKLTERCIDSHLIVCCSLENVSKEKKLLFVSLFFLIWGEAANVRYLPECLCYIFHHVSGIGFDVSELLSERYSVLFSDINSSQWDHLAFYPGSLET